MRQLMRRTHWVWTLHALCSAALQICAVISLILLPDDCCIVVRRSDWIQSYKCLFLAEFDLIFTECDWDKQKHDTGWIVDYRHSAVPTENNTETQNYIAKLSSCVFLVAIRVLYLFLSELVTNSQPRQHRALAHRNQGCAQILTVIRQKTLPHPHHRIYTYYLALIEKKVSLNFFITCLWAQKS